MRRVTTSVEVWPLREAFAISRDVRTEVEVVVVAIADGAARGRGEGRPYARYGWSKDSVLADVERVRPAVESGATRAQVLDLLPPGAARNAIDCALLDLEAKSSGVPAWKILGAPKPRDVVTAFTIGLDTPEKMAAAARRESARPLLKLKVAGKGDEARVAAVRAAAPRATLIVDANEAWPVSELESMLAAMARHGVALVEQPLPAGDDAALARVRRPVPVCADESCHDVRGLAELRDRYDAVNVKLDKTGGATAALALVTAARAAQLRVMIGCMVGTSLAMAPAQLLAPLADFVDLDGPLLLAKDREPGIRYDGSTMHPADAAVWG